MSVDVSALVTENLDIWSSTIKAKNSQGRGSSKKTELYGVKKLRELILDLAVRGLLVQQDPNDEPASVLLEKIGKEKEKLVKLGKLKKTKPLAPINRDNTIDLPHGWCLARMPEVISSNKYALKRGPFGSSLKKSFFVNEGYKVYEQQHAINDDFYRGEYYISEDKYHELSAFEVKPNDLIISCSGTVGKVAIAPDDIEPGIINQALLKITLNESALTNAYFKILFPAFFMKTETLSDLQGTAQKNMVSVDTLKNEPFPSPPVNEQHRIVTKVNELMTLCDQLEQQQESSISAHKTLVETLLGTLVNAADAEVFDEAWQRIAANFDVLFTTEHSINQLKQTILQLAVMGKLVPQDPNNEPANALLKKIAEEKARLVKEKKIKKQKILPPISDEEKPFELPEGWEWCRTDDFCAGITSGSTPPKSEFLESEGVPYLKVYNIRNQTIDFEYKSQFVSPEFNNNKLTRSILYPGDVVMNIVGPPLGKTAIIPESHPKWNCNQAIVFFRCIEKRINRYLYIYIKAGVFLKFIELIGTAGQDNISVTKSRTMVIPMPPLEEQHRIVTKVNELMTLCETLLERIKTAQTTQLNLTDAIAEQTIG